MNKEIPEWLTTLSQEVSTAVKDLSGDKPNLTSEKWFDRVMSLLEK